MKGMDEISPQLQNQIVQYQQAQQQLQAVATQRAQIEAQLRGLEESTQAVADADKDAPIYRMVGGVLIRAKDRKALLEELKDRKETMEVRLRALEKQEKHLKERFMSLHEQITKVLGAQGGAGPQ